MNTQITNRGDLTKATSALLEASPAAPSEPTLGIVHEQDYDGTIGGVLVKTTGHTTAQVHGYAAS